MRICASPGIPEINGEAMRADLIEIRMDVFPRVPEVNKEMVITLCGRPMPDITEFNGYVDAGTGMRMSRYETISSIHLDHVPEHREIMHILEGMDGDMVKGAFAVRNIGDLCELLQASKMERRHIIIGLGVLGTITRIRQRTMNNEFTYAHTGTPTAEGQLSVDEMLRLGDDCIVTGLVGKGLSDASERLHDVFFIKNGIAGKYLTLDVPDLNGLRRFVTGYSVRGLNVTSPYKIDVIGHLDVLDDAAEEIGAVNTILNDRGTLKGYNTDVIGIEHAFIGKGVDVSGKRALVIGTGGVARACIYYLKSKGCDVTVTGRNMDLANGLASRFGCASRHPRSVALQLHDIIINCTSSPDALPVPMDLLDRSHVVFDVIHWTETVLQRNAETLGCITVDAADMLKAQAEASFRIWMGA